MPTETPRRLLEAHYDRAAQEYLYNLKPEHFMEATAQATQRKITLASMDQVHEFRPEIQTFNELLVQYKIPDRKKPRRVVPDNMVVVHSEPIHAGGHFSLALQPTRPFWVMDYISNSSRRRDYVNSLRKYEEDLKVPYYLVFYPDNPELSLLRQNGAKYVSVLPNDNGLLAITELEMAVSLVEGWVRFWYRGQLLPLTGEMQRELIQAREEASRARSEAANQRQRAEQAEQEAARLREHAQQAERKLEESETTLRDRAAQFAQMQADLARLRQSGDTGS